MLQRNAVRSIARTALSARIDAAMIATVDFKNIPAWVKTAVDTNDRFKKLNVRRSTPQNGRAGSGRSDSINGPTSDARSVGQLSRLAWWRARASRGTRYPSTRARWVSAFVAVPGRPSVLRLVPGRPLPHNADGRV